MNVALISPFTRIVHLRQVEELSLFLNLLYINEIEDYWS